MDQILRELDYEHIAANTWRRNYAAFGRAMFFVSTPSAHRSEHLTELDFLSIDEITVQHESEMQTCNGLQAYKGTHSETELEVLLLIDETTVTRKLLFQGNTLFSDNMSRQEFRDLAVNELAFYPVGSKKSEWNFGNYALFGAAALVAIFIIFAWPSR